MAHPENAKIAPIAKITRFTNTTDEINAGVGVTATYGEYGEGVENGFDEAVGVGVGEVGLPVGVGVGVGVG